MERKPRNLSRTPFCFIELYLTATTGATGQTRKPPRNWWLSRFQSWLGWLDLTSFRQHLRRVFRLIWFRAHTYEPDSASRHLPSFVRCACTHCEYVERRGRASSGSSQRTRKACSRKRDQRDEPQCEVHVPPAQRDPERFADKTHGGN